MEYRVERETQTADLEELSSKNMVRSGESIQLRVKVERSGSLYIFGKQSDGSLIWLNAEANGKVPLIQSGDWLSVPRNDYIRLGEQEGTEEFLVIYVPSGKDWSLAEVIAPKKISVSQGIAELDSQAASKISDDLKRERAAELKSAGAQSGVPVSFKLNQAGEAAQLAFYEIKLSHISRR